MSSSRTWACWSPCLKPVAMPCDTWMPRSILAWRSARHSGRRGPARWHRHLSASGVLDRRPGAGLAIPSGSRRTRHRTMAGRALLRAGIGRNRRAIAACRSARCAGAARARGPCGYLALARRGGTQHRPDTAVTAGCGAHALASGVPPISMYALYQSPAIGRAKDIQRNIQYENSNPVVLRRRARTRLARLPSACWRRSDRQ
ncbi:hypothetical protein DAMDJJ_23895 [Cupriavidus necator]